ncbi:DMT family transporter [uncultured Tateyamaria sp.]|uniref:DMT family transporter n=1 Tax=Tateyamaria sp. 1078 TaxID=3417464 RepID=UPI00260CCDD0|nr:DMT family transporter [uncultured Tateyamaria sp.]
MTDVRHGIWLRLLAAFLITAMSAAVHEAAKTVAIGQIMFWRSVIALVPIVIYTALRSEFPQALQTARPGLHLTRGLFGAFSMAMSFVSLAYLPVANAQALAFLAPILVLPLAALWLHEVIGWRLYMAVGAGFCGVLGLLWDALERPGQGALIGVVAGLAYAVTMAFVRVHTKRMTITERPATIAFYFAITSAVVGLMTLPFGWAETTGPALLWLVVAGLLGGLAHIAANEAVLRSPISTLAPFDFTSLIWALLFDVVIFAQLPGIAGLMGMAIVTAAAVYVAVHLASRPQN